MLQSKTAHGLTDPFSSTHWSVITAAAADDAERALAALTELCQTYWPPLYSFVRSRGHSVHDAQDLTQSFFAFLIENKIYRRARRGKGRFRAFLLASIKNFLADSYDHDHAVKRGGRHKFVSFSETQLEEVEANFRTNTEGMEELDADRVYERTWAETLVRDSLENLSRIYESEGKQDVFRQLRVFLTGSAEPLPAYSDLARQLGIQESTLRSHITRLRARYRDRLSAEVRRTVAREAEVKGELRELLRVLTTT